MSPYRTPALCAVSAISGLVLALLSNGFGDALALVFLAAPVGVIVRHGLRARAKSKPEHA